MQKPRDEETPSTPSTQTPKAKGQGKRSTYTLDVTETGVTIEAKGALAHFNGPDQAKVTIPFDEISTACTFLRKHESGPADFVTLRNIKPQEGKAIAVPKGDIDLIAGLLETVRDNLKTENRRQLEDSLKAGFDTPTCQGCGKAHLPACLHPDELPGNGPAAHGLSAKDADKFDY